MTFHHFNRLIKHWEHTRKPEGASLAWGSRERYEKLAPSSVALGQLVASHLNLVTNTFQISNKTLQKETGFSKETITKALAELVAWGILQRTRVNKEKPYLYSLLVECPEDCERFEEHYTPSELVTLPKKQATPLPREQETPQPKKQARAGLINRELIEINKETNRDIDRQSSSLSSGSCHSCQGESYREAVVHQQSCPNFQKLKTGKPWQITQDRNSEQWPKWDYLERQKATIDGLRAWNDKNKQTTQDQSEKFKLMVADQAGNRTLLPRWSEWLETRVSSFSLSKIAVKDLKLALTWSGQGVDIPREITWQSAPHTAPLEWNEQQFERVDLEL